MVTLILVPTLYWLVQDKLMARLRSLGARISGTDEKPEPDGEKQYA
jgi:hypothetical protein